MLNIKRVAVAVSGGVDSAVAALLIKKKGYDVVGVYMQNWDVMDETGLCSGAGDAEDAQWVCRVLGIPFYHVSFVKEYWNDIFCNLIEDYKKGYTPNPDILCNHHIKFNSFYKYATERLEACAIATGHYVRSSFGDYLESYNASAGARLLKPADSFKDQTFFLSQVPQVALQRTMFPLGSYTKPQVKRIASASEMSSLVRKKESMGICFIGTRNFQKFISKYVDDKPGCFIDVENGQVVGTHAGIHQWTLGQRCRIGGQPQPYFVARKHTKTDDIFVAPGTAHPSLFVEYFLTSKPHWIHSIPSTLINDHVFECEFRFQHTKPLQKCRVTVLNDEELLVALDTPLRAITPGQYAVFYLGEECVGSSRIISLGPSLQSLGLTDRENSLIKFAALQ